MSSRVRSDLPAARLLGQLDGGDVRPSDPVRQDRVIDAVISFPAV